MSTETKMLQQNDDHDLIPDILQKSSAQPDEPVPGPEPDEAPKKPGIFGRLFGSKPKPYPDIHEKIKAREDQAGRTEPWHKRHEDQTDQSASAKRSDSWVPLDFAGRQKIQWNKNFNDPKAFQKHVKQDLKQELGPILSPQQRIEVAKMAKDSRTHGLRSGELVKKLDKKVKEGKFSKFEAKKIRQSMHMKRSSGLF